MSKKRNAQGEQSAQTQQALARLEKNVTAKIDERQKMLAVIKPVLEEWRKRLVAQVEELQFDNPAYSNTFDKVDDWQGAIFLLGSIYQVERKASQTKTTEGKKLLAYVWRVTFEFSTAIGSEERKNLIKAFGLDDNATKTPNKSLLKKLNALQHRPLVVAESIMMGDKPFKFDETLASFVRQVVEIDKYTYTDQGETRPVTSMYMRDWINANWEMVKTATTKTALMGQWNDMGYSLSLEQKAARSKDARDSRIKRAVERAIVSPDGRAFIDTITSLSADNKALACQEYDKRQLARGLAPIRPGAPLYFSMRVIFEKDKAPTGETLERAITELAMEKARLESRLMALRQAQAAQRLVPAVTRAVDAGIVTGTIANSDNGQVVTEVTPVEQLPAVA